MNLKGCTQGLNVENVLCILGFVNSVRLMREFKVWFAYLDHMQVLIHEITFLL